MASRRPSGLKAISIGSNRVSSCRRMRVESIGEFEMFPFPLAILLRERHQRFGAAEELRAKGDVRLTSCASQVMEMRRASPLSARSW